MFEGTSVYLSVCVFKYIVFECACVFLRVRVFV